MSIAAMIFSRNRAMQLDALWRSIVKRMPGVFSTSAILWRTDSPAHERAYMTFWKEAAQLNAPCFGVSEKDFNRDFHELLNRLAKQHEYICFFTDDDIVYRTPSEFPLLKSGALGYSLRLGANTTWDYMNKRPQAKGTGDFAYPFSLDGTAYRSIDVLKWIYGLSFRNPNDLEHQVCQYAMMANAELDCGFHSSVVNIPHNAVSDSATPSMGGSAEILRQLYERGYRIDFEQMDFGEVIAAHQEIPYRFSRLANAAPVFSILHPTARLPEGWKAAHDCAISNADAPELAEYTLIVDSRDPQPPATSSMRVLSVKSNTPNVVFSCNRGAVHSNGSILINAQDDVFFPPHWDTELLKVIPDLDAEFVLHVSSGSDRDAELMIPQIMSRKRYERYGYFFYPEYASVFGDDELTEHAYHDGVVIQARHLMFEHRHPVFNKGEWDEVYERENAPDLYESGRAILHRRRKEIGFGKHSIPAMRPNNRKTIAWCLPGESFRMLVVAQHFNLFFQLAQRFNVMPMFSYCSNVYVVREHMTHDLRKLPMKPDYILWMDDDNIASWEQVEMLISDLDAYPDVDVIAGWCYAIPDGNWTHDRTSVGTFDDKRRCVSWTAAQVLAEPRGLKQVDWTGFPTVLMRPSVLDKLGAHPFAPILSEDYEYGLAGEDISFSIRAKQAGLKIMVDDRVRVAHLKINDAAPMTPVFAAEPAPTGQERKDT